MHLQRTTYIIDRRIIYLAVQGMLLEDSAVIVDSLRICLVEGNSSVSRQEVSAVVLGCSGLLLRRVSYSASIFWYLFPLPFLACSAFGV